MGTMSVWRCVALGAVAAMMAFWASAPPALAEPPEDVVALRAARQADSLARIAAEKALRLELQARRAAEIDARRAELRRLAQRRSLISDIDELKSVSEVIVRDDAIAIADSSVETPQYPIVVDVDARELHFYDPSGVRLTFPVATARPDIQDYGVMRITKKRFEPTWIPTPNQRRIDPTLPQVVRPGPENPLGTRALNLNVGYLRIHGTNEPWTIGQAVSDGCVRLSNEHVELLYDVIDVGMKVKIH